MDARARAGKVFRGFAGRKDGYPSRSEFFGREEGLAAKPSSLPNRRCGNGVERFSLGVPASTPDKKKGPRRCRGPSLARFRVRRVRHRYRCRRHPEISKTNPFQISCWHCPNGTVNGAYTLISKVNRVLTISIAANLAVMRCGYGEVR